MATVSESREHGMLFTGEMVRAMLSDLDPKTNTRRGITRHRSVDVSTGKMPTRELWDRLDWSNVLMLPEPVCGYYNVLSVGSKVPVGGYTGLACRIRKGDRIWVRETWRVFGYSGPPETSCVTLQYRALGEMRNVVVRGHEGEWPQATNVWRSPLRMPRWASRILLEVTADPWPQQIGDITEEQCRAEGVRSRAEFEALWQSINGTWDPAAWVWVYSFRRVQP